MERTAARESEEKSLSEVTRECYKHIVYMRQLYFLVFPIDIETLQRKNYVRSDTVCGTVELWK